MTIVILGIDLGKNSCSVVGLDKSGAVVLRRRMRRQTILGFAAKLPGCVIALEACCGAHYLGRLLMVQGHTVRLMSSEYVRPYVKAQKNDDRDAEAIAESASRPTMHFVELKSEEQLDNDGENVWPAPFARGFCLDAAPGSLPPRSGSKDAPQPAARSSPRARSHLPTGAAQARTSPGRPCRRSNLRREPPHAPARHRHAG